MPRSSADLHGDSDTLELIPLELDGNPRLNGDTAGFNLDGDGHVGILWNPSQ